MFVIALDLVVLVMTAEEPFTLATVVLQLLGQLSIMNGNVKCNVNR
jgi:hypothetical protein